MSETTAKKLQAENELLRAQLIQCTTAMREVSSDLKQFWNTLPGEAYSLFEMARRLDSARGNAVNPQERRHSREVELHTANVAVELRDDRIADLERKLKLIVNDRNIVLDRNNELETENYAITRQRNEYYEGWQKAARSGENAFAAYREQANRTRRDGMDPTRPQTLNAALGLAGETGEVVDLIKKAYFHEKSPSTEDLLGEIGDVLFYLDWIAQRYDLTLQQVADANIAKLKARYPDGFVVGGGVR